MKTCKKCGCLKPLCDYYKATSTADGHAGKCKECHKARIRQVRAENIEYYREFDRKRGNLPCRVAARAAYAATPAGKMAGAKARRAYMTRSPERRAAHVAVGNAIRDGVLVKLPCAVCGAKRVEAHHPSYSMPLDVIWLCTTHHNEIHHDRPDKN